MTLPPSGSSPQALADALWSDLISGNDQKRSAAIKALAFAPESVSEIVMMRSGEAAAAFYASPEGQVEWEDQADWRALDTAPVFEDEDESA